MKRLPRLLLKRTTGESVVLKVDRKWLATLLARGAEAEILEELASITVTTVNLSRGGVTLIVEAPKCIGIRRGELPPGE